MLSRSATSSANHGSWSARQQVRLGLGHHGGEVVGVPGRAPHPARRARPAARRRTRGSSPASACAARRRPAAAATCRRATRAGPATSSRVDVADHGGRARRGHAGREDRQLLGQACARRGQQVPAPLDDRAQRAVPGQRGAAAAGQQPEAVGQPRGDVVQRHRAQPGRGQLDGQRQPVEPAHDLDHRADGRRRRSSKSGRTAAARSANSRTAGYSKRLGRRSPSAPAGPAAARRAAPRRRCRAARGWWPARAAPGHCAEQVVGQPRRSPRSGARSCRGRAPPACRRARRAARVRASRGRHAARGRSSRCISRRPSELEHGLRHVGGGGHRGQLDQPDAVRRASRGSRAAASLASRVLPAPPGPTSVTSRFCSSDLPMRATSSSRPTKLVSWALRFVRRAPAGGSGVAVLAAQRRRGGSPAARRDGSTPSSSASRAAHPLVGVQRVGLPARRRRAPGSAGAASRSCSGSLGDQGLELGDRARPAASAVERCASARSAAGCTTTGRPAAASSQPAAVSASRRPRHSASASASSAGLVGAPRRSARAARGGELLEARARRRRPAATASR